MSGIYTYTVEPTSQDIIWGVLRHAHLLAALVCLALLAFGPKLLEEEPPAT